MNPDDLQFLSFLTEEEREKLTKSLLLIKAAEKPSLAEFVEATVNFKLHDWQRDHLCPLLERLRTERERTGKGLRVAIHAPPQFGKSVIVSQRLPAWLIGCEPTHRVGLACYNETHSTGFGQVVLSLMQSEVYQNLFPSPELVLQGNAPAARFQTAARAALRDGQASFLAMGLQSGFVGKGVDTLLIDDPYKSAEEARSETINEKVYRWWTQTASPRIPEASNVVLMFHRYHSDDLAARLIDDGFEYVRFPAIADGNADGSDPTGREIGALLSPMRSLEWLEAKRSLDAQTFAGQFQGTPTADTGGFFNVDKLREISADDVPPMIRKVRAWDLAATKDSGDWTVGVLMGVDAQGRFYVLDVVRGRWATDERNAKIVATAKSDGPSVRIRGAQDPGQAGVDAALAFTRMLAGFAVKTVRVSGAKHNRAEYFSAQVNGGNVAIVKGDWNRSFKNELRAFLPNNSAGVDDQVDSASDAFNELATASSAVPLAKGRELIRIPIKLHPDQSPFMKW